MTSYLHNVRNISDTKRHILSDSTGADGFDIAANIQTNPPGVTPHLGGV